MTTVEPSVALVTGAGSADGIGFAAARRLAAVGHRVVVTATSERIHERAAEIGGLGVIADLTDSSAAADLVNLATERGRLDILVNNAGMTSTTEPDRPAAIDALSDDDWRDSLARNLDSMFYVTRAAVRAMRTARYGRIVNVASVSGPVVAFAGDVAYHAAKAGVLGLIRSVAFDVAADGITVNAVAPGWIATQSSTAEEARYGR